MQDVYLLFGALIWVYYKKFLDATSAALPEAIATSPDQASATQTVQVVRVRHDATAVADVDAGRSRNRPRWDRRRSLRIHLSDAVISSIAKTFAGGVEAAHRVQPTAPLVLLLLLPPLKQS